MLIRLTPKKASGSVRFIGADAPYLVEVRMAKSEICKCCCPSGGALFDICMPAASDEPVAADKFIKRCRNCGTEKPWRRRFSAKREARRAAREALIKELTA
jgi:hypothetical protein